ncbi:MAG: hypothetical protein OHK93_007947 [Ramalina farinacea]|uniref:ACB domain-containing protein n=1 Tax=Ramalina farinacea TaxID=258253 RepID=A0AA43TRF9_9LECA|nr:hypothetical protein [Ramalina farinacea]
MVTESPTFKKAVEDSRKLKSKPTDDDLLHIYGLYKTGTGADIATAEKPGMFDLKGKAKMKAWTKVVEEDKLTPGQAQQEYVKKVEGLKGSCGF